MPSGVVGSHAVDHEFDHVAINAQLSCGNQRGGIQRHTHRISRRKRIGARITVDIIPEENKLLGNLACYEIPITGEAVPKQIPPLYLCL